MITKFEMHIIGDHVTSQTSFDALEAVESFPLCSGAFDDYLNSLLQGESKEAWPEKMLNKSGAN